LARDGFDLILVDRQVERTQSLADELTRAHGVKTFAITQDLCDPKAASKLRTACSERGCTVDVLVNNAAVVPNQFVHQLPWPEVRDNIQLLLGSVVELCHLFLPSMIERGWGRIINVASMSGLLPGSVRLGTYNASKAFLIPFSEALNTELAGTGVQVTALCPGFMNTGIFASSDLNDVRDSVFQFLWSDPERVADAGVGAVMQSAPVRLSGWSNYVIIAASKVLPRTLLRERSRIFHSSAHHARPHGANGASVLGKSAALITGASAGIGASFAEALARQGYDVVLVARRGELLERRAAELTRSYGVRTHVIVQDLGDTQAVETILAECDRLGWPIDVLVNNAGSPVTELFHRMRWPEIESSLNLLVGSVVEMCHRFVPKMVARGRGKVINVASVAALQPGTYRSSLYTSAKTFVLAYSESMAADLRGTGVTVTALCPGFTRTEWLGKLKLENNPVPEIFWMDSDAVAAAGLRAAERGAPFAIAATPAMRALYALFKMAPRSMVRAALSNKRREIGA
jgi:short-subunit dehydrogenase